MNSLNNEEVRKMIAHNYNLVIQKEIRDHKVRAQSLALKMTHGQNLQLK